MAGRARLRRHLAWIGAGPDVSDLAQARCALPDAQRPRIFRAVRLSSRSCRAGGPNRTAALPASQLAPNAAGSRGDGCPRRAVPASGPGTRLLGHGRGRASWPAHPTATRMQYTSQALGAPANADPRIDGPRRGPLFPLRVFLTCRVPALGYPGHDYYTVPAPAAARPHYDRSRHALPLALL